MAKQPPPGTNPSQNITLVSAQALEKRIRRRLRQDGLQLRKNRAGTIDHQAHGQWLVVDPGSRAIHYRQITLARLAQELGLLAAGEQAEDHLAGELFVGRYGFEDNGPDEYYVMVRRPGKPSLVEIVDGPFASLGRAREAMNGRLEDAAVSAKLIKGGTA